ncbi:ThiF family adenylyltransferase [Pedobacter boryungensis]|uniref:ThiF family adenylyltransferase n=1 Tax=Pedobacter boryungensis TaxID=869962 RepID=A0ABX2DEC8_9SPHI|nr:ThiF family adenylyltransferase [Pedobacter boryungensis]NQX31641.1 ThiF family adenylyltransferase [Pedobacter boryungensis]
MKETWYKERNKRTDSFSELNKGYYDIKVLVVVTSDVSLFATQVMLTMFTNILARWCSNITINSADAERIIFNGSQSNRSILEMVKNSLSEIDPYGHFEFNVDNPLVDFTVFIGRPEPDCKTPYLSIDASGWVASCSFNGFAECNGNPKSVANPLGSAFAACLANAELFRWSNNIRAEAYSKWYDVYSSTVSDIPIQNDYDLGQLDLGRVHVIGCGAIGSSFTYLLGLFNFTGEILFVDVDSTIELHNTSSSLLFNTTNCKAHHQKKAEICEAYLQDTGYKVRSFNDDYKEYSYDHRKASNSADVIMCFANDFDIWSTVQNLYPPVVFHATTSRSWGINIGRHIPLKDNCIMCTFQNLSKVIFVPKCAEVELTAPDESIIENQEEQEPHASILPFLSPSAAIVAFAELIKLINGKVDKENSTQFNMATYLGDFVEDQQKAKNCDICRGQSEAIYKSLKVKLDY